jgi:hypothetical protein
MNIILVFLISLLHFIFGFLIFTILLLSNNTKYLFIILCISIILKILYTINGRCIITKYEKNKYFYPIFTYFSEMFLIELSYKKREEIAINLCLLFIIYKLFVLLILKYYNILIR